MEKRELTCIGCPMGCAITVELENGEVVSVTGNTCGIGDKYARNEVTHPERTVTSTAVILGGDKPRVSVKTKSNIPKDKIDAVMKEIDAAVLQAPIRIGDIVVKNVCGTGVDVVATRNVEKI
ncbi:DUF1667 domain-containing protein [Pseudobutyrivibrio sp.]|uniref:DUF1667 domain-containing protein n=1 Tax=Pseudobutyrivibrio sp. TaxID=2014367 RepID=UPI0025F17A6B|nr:DUF1667 domain-containing protein [Pseudobutyrivibrio sp.]MBR5649184.1 DUF1667 domain-containing protein [Pseudobutyrivibrio sp.]